MKTLRNHFLHTKMPSKDKIISNFIVIYDLKWDLNPDKAWNPSPENIKRKGTTFRLPEL